MNVEFWKGKRVLITGHTGFKGSWTSLLLSQLNANLYGIALAVESDKTLYKAAKNEQLFEQEYFIDIRNTEALVAAILEIKPDIIIHMAAQSLVRESYNSPVSTFSTNIMGTINVFEAARKLDNKCAIVNITSDKCYENKEWLWAYRENEPMGGLDPYSCSKGCSELITASYRNSFFKECGITLASARAGNVVGGGDWAIDRLIPDIFKSHCSNTPIVIRSPNAIRPWQFVLEPIFGYLILAEHLYEKGNEFSEGWNFGPSDEASKTVSWVTTKFLKYLQSNCKVIVENTKLHEANLLKLDSSKSKSILNWKPCLDIDSCLQWTANWYSASEQSENLQELSLKQINDYISLAQSF